jgi:predicted phage terminase large subunit-like protein
MERVELKQLSGAYAFLDPSGGKTGTARLGRTLARSAIVVLAEDQWRRIVVLEAWAKRCPTPELVEAVFRVNAQWKVRRFGIEANAMQSLFADSVELIAREKKVRLPVVPVMQNTRIEKTFRIRAALQPVIESGRLIVGRDQQELRNELKAFPRGQTVDLVDALASCVTMLPEVSEEVRGKEAGEDLARYLRQEGVPAAEIEKRMARFYREERDGMVG